MNYVPLHVHSDASLDGAGTVQSLVERAKAMNFPALALTDHGTLANAVAFWSACDETDIKPILGLEAYLLYNSKRHHLTLLSTNENGFNNLINLSNWAWEHNYAGGFPLITLDKLNEYRAGLFALSGCAASALYVEDETAAQTYLGELMDTMGAENSALEVMFVGTHNTWSRPYEYTKRFDLQHIVTNDTHYPCRHQFAAHQAICSARHGFTYDSQHLWLKSYDEIVLEGTKFAPGYFVEQGLLNSLDLAGRVTSWSMKAKPTLPEIKDAPIVLQDALRVAIKIDVERKGGKTERVARLKREFKILYEKGFLDYVYILWDIVKWAKSCGIYVGPGRGSGGGSYVLYLLGITSVDPLEFGLLFERFINLARADYPDVDTDFESERRHEVIEYAMQRWGCVPIATYSTYSHKSAVHDIAKVLKIPKDLEIPAADAEADSDAFRDFIKDKSDALVCYDTMMGQIRHRGKHAAGVIIPNRPVPIERAGDILVSAWGEGGNAKDLSKVGIVKYDILSLSALSMLRMMGEMSRCPVEAIDWVLDDPATYDIFCKGDVSGIFQWSGSDGIRDLTMRIQPRNFYDLTTCNALYRPGALHAGTAERYPHYMKHPRRLHPRLDPLLAKTYGVICYQEQVMAVVAEMMGGDLVEAEVIRRLISKASVGDPKWEKDMSDTQERFFDGASAQGYPRGLVEQIWKEVYTHSGYSYNLSHATAYTLISYQMAWFKAHFRPEFTVAVLQHDRANAQTYMLDAIANGLKVGMPHVNFSTKDYSLKDDTIWLPLTDIDHVGEAAVDAIIESRSAGNFTSYEDFATRVPKKKCNNRVKQHLERIGAFQGFSGDPKAAIENYDTLPIKGIYQTQLEMLGYVVPSRELYEKIEKARSAPAKKGYTRFAGFVREVKQKTSDHGPYCVFSLSPEGSFWIRGEEAKKKFPIGTFVSGTKSHFGHSIDVKKYRLDTGE